MDCEKEEWRKVVFILHRYLLNFPQRNAGAAWGRWHYISFGAQLLNFQEFSGN